MTQSNIIEFPAVTAGQGVNRSDAVLDLNPLDLNAVNTLRLDDDD